MKRAVFFLINFIELTGLIGTNAYSQNPDFIYKPLPKQYQRNIKEENSFRNKVKKRFSDAYDLTLSLPMGYVND